MHRRNNRIPVIEIVPDESLAYNNPSSSVYEGDIDPPVPLYPVAVADNNFAVTGSSVYKTEILDYSQGTSSVILNDKVAFKEKMREILSCRICLELKRSPMYQCKYGHLICAGCFNDILAESHVQNEIASCPHCQTTITKDLCFRNVAVEKTISELPVACRYCSKEFPPENLRYHEAVICEHRPSVCSNCIIGCAWQGPNVERLKHEQECNQPSANGYEILKSLADLDQQQKEGMELYNKLMELLSVEKISYTDLQLKHCKHETEDTIFESAKFSAFEVQWLIRACCVCDTSKNIDLSFQLVAKNKLLSTMNLQYFLLRGPYNDMEIKPKVCQFKFTDKTMESPYHTLDISRTLDKENFYSAKRINIRIFMFIVR